MRVSSVVCPMCIIHLVKWETFKSMLVFRSQVFCAAWTEECHRMFQMLQELIEPAFTSRKPSLICAHLSGTFTSIAHVEGKHVNISVLIWTLNVELKALMYENSSLGTDKKGFHDYCNIAKLFLLCLLHRSLKKYMQKNCFH